MWVKIITAIAVVVGLLWWWYGDRVKTMYNLVNNVKDDSKPVAAKLSENGKYLELKFNYGGKEHDLFVPYSVSANNTVHRISTKGEKKKIAHPSNLPWLLTEKDADFRFEVVGKKSVLDEDI